jgi:hypothetical protein
MIPNIKNINKLLDKIKKDAPKEHKDYKTGIVGEAMIISAYDSMTLTQLLGLREILTDIIKAKKEKAMMIDANKQQK